MFVLNEMIEFPDPGLADPDGLLAVGGDLEPERLIRAYRSGIFPWFQDEGIIYWFSPPNRFVLFPEEIKISHSMRQVMNSKKFTITKDHAFEEVIRRCASFHRQHKKDTWIDHDFIQAYVRLHRLGHAHSFETWHDHQLVGGLYGVETGSVFCGESMFSAASNSSKAALIELCLHDKYRLIDCQIYTEHLERMGARLIRREEFLHLLHEFRRA